MVANVGSCATHAPRGDDGWTIWARWRGTGIDSGGLDDFFRILKVLCTIYGRDELRILSLRLPFR